MPDHLNLWNKKSDTTNNNLRSEIIYDSNDLIKIYLCFKIHWNMLHYFISYIFQYLNPNDLKSPDKISCWNPKSLMVFFRICRIINGNEKYEYFLFHNMRPADLFSRYRTWNIGNFVKSRDLSWFWIERFINNNVHKVEYFIKLHLLSNETKSSGMSSTETIDL